MNTQNTAEQQVKIQVKVRNSELPLCCPLPTMTLWDMHPRVYLELSQENEALCPYCGTNYILATDD